MTDRLCVLFVRIANGARSLIVEAILRHTDGEHFATFSAGMCLVGVDPCTLSVLEHAGTPTQGLSSKPLETFAGESFDYLINLCNKDIGELVQLPYSAQILVWSCSDPALQEGLEGSSHVLQELNDRVRLFLAVKNRPHGERSRAVLSAAPQSPCLPATRQP